jgi:sec-independent protein translocase protein TatB
VFNLGAGEVLVILLLALIVLGPQRLPDAARQVGRFTSEIRKLSSGFQQEMKAAFEEETEAQARARGAVATGAAAATEADESDAPAELVEPAADLAPDEPVASAPADSAVPADDDADRPA